MSSLIPLLVALLVHRWTSSFKEWEKYKLARCLVKVLTMWRTSVNS